MVVGGSQVVYTPWVDAQGSRKMVVGKSGRRSIQDSWDVVFDSGSYTD